MKYFIKKWLRQFICEHTWNNYRRVETGELLLVVDNQNPETMKWEKGKSYKTIFFSVCKKCGQKRVKTVNWQKLIR